MLLIVSVEAAAKFQLDYAVPRSQPPDGGLSELAWIRDRFGFDNPKVIIDVRDTHSFLWALAYDGGLIYYGNLFYLLANQTDYGLLNNADPVVRSDYVGSIQKLWIYGALRDLYSGKYLILVPSDIYVPDVFERHVLTMLGGGIFSVRQTTISQVQQLFAAWNYSRISDDALAVAAPYIVARPLAGCSTYSNWWSNSSWQTVSVAPNFTTASSCSIHVSIRSSEESDLYVSLTPNSTWNLANETYVGFYFRGTGNATGDYSLKILLTTGHLDYMSYYNYTITDKGLWDGRIHGLLLLLSQFQRTASAEWSSISGVRIGVYTSQAANFDYNLQYLVTAHDN